MHKSSRIAVWIVVCLGMEVMADDPKPPKTSQAESELKYVKSVCIQGSDWGSDQADCQIKLVCRQGIGKDAGEEVYLGCKVRDDFGDVRFRDETGYLHYWMERCEPGDRAVFWVRVPKIPRNESVRVQLHYGNPAVTTTSNGKETFPFFDDFLGDYAGKPNQNVPCGWENGDDTKKANRWIVKDGVIMFRGRGHLNTPTRIWPKPSEACCTLRFRAKWPEPPFANPGENGESIGGISWKETDGNAWMDIIGLWQNKHEDQFRLAHAASFGRLPGSDHDLGHRYEFVLARFKDAYVGEFYTYEIERRPDRTLARIIETGDELSSQDVIDDELYLMIHGCKFGFPNSPYLSVDWMLLRRQAYPNPSYGDWKR